MTAHERLQVREGLESRGVAREIGVPQRVDAGQQVAPRFALHARLWFRRPAGRHPRHEQPSQCHHRHHHESAGSLARRTPRRRHGLDAARGSQVERLEVGRQRAAQRDHGPGHAQFARRRARALATGTDRVADGQIADLEGFDGGVVGRQAVDHVVANATVSRHRPRHAVTHDLESDQRQAVGAQVLLEHIDAGPARQRNREGHLLPDPERGLTERRAYLDVGGSGGCRRHRFAHLREQDRTST